MSAPSLTRVSNIPNHNLVPSSLRRFHETGQLHFITFSCYHRKPKLASIRARAMFERALEQMRCAYGSCVFGYVVMPEHVHLLVSEPECTPLSTALQALKQSVARSLALRQREPFWQARYYDFNVWSARKHIEKLRYIHRNPVARGLVERPEDWEWSSFRHYATGIDRVVEIESKWTVRRRELKGQSLGLRAGPATTFPPACGPR
jgi:putative transposase